VVTLLRSINEVVGYIHCTMVGRIDVSRYFITDVVSSNCLQRMLYRRGSVIGAS
jgi:hypothetical protein